MLLVGQVFFYLKTEKNWTKNKKFDKFWLLFYLTLQFLLIFDFFDIKKLALVISI